MDDVKRHAIEWDCQKIARQYYHLMDQRNYDEAVLLFTPDINWQVMGLDLHGREAVREAFGGLTDSTIRHVLTNTIVEVIDEEHANSTSYVTIYVEKGFPDDGPIVFEGPNRLAENHDKMLLTKKGWRIAHRTGQRAFGHD